MCIPEPKLESINNFFRGAHSNQCEEVTFNSKRFKKKSKFHKVLNSFPVMEGIQEDDQEPSSGGGGEGVPKSTGK